MRKIYLIGEIGINHNGDLKLAKQIIDLAKNAGFNAVKFKGSDTSVPDYKRQIKNSPWRNITYLEYKKIEFGVKEYDEINKYCKNLKLNGLQVHGILS